MLLVGSSGCGSRRFTLVEMLVVIMIVSVLAALLLPAMQKSLGMARSASCANRLKENGIAFHLFVGDNDGTLPGKPTDWFRYAQLGQYVGNTQAWWFNKNNEVYFCPSVGEIAICQHSPGQYSAGGFAINAALTGFGTRPERLGQVLAPMSIWPIFVDGICQRWVGWGTIPYVDDINGGLTWANTTASYWSFAFGYSKRHDGFCNVTFGDGHVASFPDLYGASLARKLLYEWNKR